MKYRPSDVKFPRPKGLPQELMDEVVLKRKDALGHR